MSPNKVKGQRSKRKTTVNLSHFSFHISPIYAKKGHPFKDVLFYKSGDANAGERWLRRREVYLPKGVPLGHYSPTKLHGGQVRRWRQQLVTRSIAESDAAWGATKTPSQGEEGSDAYIYKKRTPVWMSFLIKVAMTYSPTNLCSTIGAVGLNFSVRDGKRWIPDAIDRLNA